MQPGSCWLLRSRRASSCSSRILFAVPSWLIFRGCLSLHLAGSCTISACVRPCRIHLHVAARQFVASSRLVQPSAFVMRIPFAFRKSCKDHTLQFSSWDLTVLTCCATFVCSAALPYSVPVHACLRVLCRVSSVSPRRHRRADMRVSLFVLCRGLSFMQAFFQWRAWFQLARLVQGVWPSRCTHTAI